jgi:signal transduction histidine kinase
LLLLSKIDNRQFERINSIDISVIIKKILVDYEEMMEFKKIEFRLNENANPVLNLNPDLAHILFSNLIRNAIFHNYQGGYIEILIEEAQVIISNSGKVELIEPDKMFERFNKGSENSFSQGLGLAIVASICELYKYRVSYSLNEEKHTVSLTFQYFNDLGY